MNHSIILWRRLKNLNVFFCYIVHFQIFFRYFFRYSIQEYTFKTKCQPLEAVYSERFLGKDILKIRSKITREHLCQSVGKHTAFFRTPFYKSTSEKLLPFHAAANPIKPTKELFAKIDLRCLTKLWIHVCFW